MLSFYPGPSRVYDEIPRYVKEAHKAGILSMNHRSEAFMDLSRKTMRLLKSRLNIPKDYTAFFASSATECWEIIAQSLVTRQSIHIYNGAFGEKWFDYTHRLHPASKAVHFDLQSSLDEGSMVFTEGEVICLTQNETSNGTQVSNDIIGSIRTNNPNHLIAVDATSSMAGIELDFSSADVWFASVQKCFGLPAGLAVMLVSPKGMGSIDQLHEKRHYNSLVLMADMMTRWQTPCTPNVLGIYLLMRSLQDRSGIRDVHKKIKRRAKDWQAFFKDSRKLTVLVENPSLRSWTVITVKAKPDRIEKVKKAALKGGFLLGEGYGALKKETFRIANFPALHKKEIKRLMDFLSPYI